MQQNQGFELSDLSPTSYVEYKIDEPVGTYYGGTIAAPVMAEIYENILPYLGIEADYSEEKIKETMSGIYIEEGD